MGASRLRVGTSDDRPGEAEIGKRSDVPARHQPCMPRNGVGLGKIGSDGNRQHGGEPLLRTKPRDPRRHLVVTPGGGHGRSGSLGRHECILGAVDLGRGTGPLCDNAPTSPRGADILHSDPCSPRIFTMTMKRYWALPLALAGGVAIGAACGLRRKAERVQGSKRQHKENLQTWEDEGGSLAAPATAGSRASVAPHAAATPTGNPAP